MPKTEADLKLAWKLDAERNERAIIELFGGMSNSEVIQNPEIAIVLIRALETVGEAGRAVDLCQLLKEPILRTGDLRLWRLWLSGYAHALVRLGEYKRAEILYLELLESVYADEAAYRFEGASLSGLGVIAAIECRFTEALALSQRALATAQRMGDVELMLVELQNSALMLRDLGRYDEALAHHERAQAIRENYEMAFVFGSQSELALLHLYRGDLRRAEVIARGSVEEMSRYPYRRMEGEVRRVYGLVLTVLGRHSEARQELERALAIARETENRLLVAECHEALAELEESSGGSEDAVRGHRAKAAEVYRAIGAPERIGRMQMQFAKLRAAPGRFRELGV